jgi:glycosyltransferase involved in cell wall biosynthesis
MKVLMHPLPSELNNSSNGISQVIQNYARYLPQYDIELVNPDQEYDVVAVHAGVKLLPPSGPTVSHNHGLYWTGDRAGAKWEWEANKNVVESIRHAKEVTVPSSWVAETLRRDMHLAPHVIPHGVNFDEWQNIEFGGFVLWNKNRQTTTCDPRDVMYLAREFSNIGFVSTFGDPGSNVQITGAMSFDQMRDLVQRCTIYLSTTKETGGIGIMEAMASGKPILGYREGAIVDLVQHGVNGYLAESPQDLVQGFEFCLKNYQTLGANSRALAREFTWEKACETVADVYRKAAIVVPPTTSVIIPCYNYSHLIERAIESCIEEADEVIVVDDGSTDNTKETVAKYPVKYIYQNNQGVAIARNRGIAESTGKYICCLDADDFIQPGLLGTCVRELEADVSLGAAYTKLLLISRDGTKVAKKASAWPGEFNYDNQVRGQNQIPTCCVFRREAWDRLGGFRQRYAPRGCGAEDAEFWLRLGSIGYGAKLATTEPLFVYSYGGNTTGDETYQEVDWLFWHPWTRDGRFPFASVATPEESKSHAVYSYDTPIVSVIVPVGPGHEKNVVSAIDSLEAQTFRKWECIVVWDSADKGLLGRYKKNYPFAQWLETEGGMGAGYARNRGVEVARAGLITFVDADDWFYPEMLEESLKEYYASGGDVAIYTDSVGKAVMSQESVDKAEHGKILFYEPSTQEAVVAQKNLAFDCEAAREQPNPARMYLWCYISTLHPKAWFEEVGGFDESMESWEDWDYWLRLARIGKCFVHLQSELMVYPYYTGNRREIGKKNAASLIQYMKGKYERMKSMPCAGCTGGRGSSPPPRMPIRQTATGITSMSQRAEGNAMFDIDRDMILANYTSPNRGDHLVIGHAVFSGVLASGIRMERTKYGYQINYGYHAGGSRFIVHRDELVAAPHLFQAARSTVPEIQLASQRRMPIPPPPDPIEELPAPANPVLASVRKMLDAEMAQEELPKPVKTDLQTLPGITADIAAQLKQEGADTPEDVLLLGIDGLKELKGVGDKKAEMILAAIQARLQ